MLGSIKYNLRNLTNFSGRDARQTFWYFVLFIAILRWIAGSFFAVPMMVKMFGTMFSAIKQGGRPEALQGQINGEMVAMMQDMVGVSIAIGVVSGLLLVAALARRLHDSDLSGWWAAVPAVLYIAALGLIPAQIHQAAEILQTAGTKPMDPAAMIQQQGTLALVAWIPLIMVIVIGVRKSTPGPNRFGESSVSF